MTAVITQGANIARLVPGDDRDNLANWFNVYMASEVGSDKKDNTFRAKLQDVERFLGYFFERTGGYQCDDWVRSVTKGFLKWLPKQHAKDRQANKTDRLLAASTQVRNVNTIKHAAKWIHRQRPFLAGVPFGKGDGIKVKRGGWKGLSDLQVNRILAAAEKLKHMSRRKDQDPVRDYAAFRVLLHTALRVDEFCSLDLSQYRGKHLVNIPRKGDVVTEKIFLDEPVRAALDEYIEESRGDKSGPLFLSKNGNRLTQQAVYFMLERIADQANTGRREKDQIEVHPHLLRHTQLRKVAREKGIEAALELSGHQSEKYIWRYVQATDDEMEDALTGNWD